MDMINYSLSISIGENTTIRYKEISEIAYVMTSQLVDLSVRSVSPVYSPHSHNWQPLTSCAKP